MRQSAVYLGHVVHQRLRPRRHRLRYRVHLWLLDLDELAVGRTGLRLFSHNRPNLFAFYDRDHGDGAARPLKEYALEQLRPLGLEAETATVKLLCCPRLLGYAFNPLSVYFYYRADGTLIALLYEVNNTFGERHSYLIPVGPADGAVRQSCAKRFYVSPFMAMGMTYNFTVEPPAEEVSIRIREDDEAGTMLVAAFTGARRALSDAMLLRLFLAYPLLTLKITLGIHWEALLLWLKGMRLVPRPVAPANPVTVVSADVR